MSTRVSDHPHHQQTFHVRLLRLAYPEATNIEAGAHRGRPATGPAPAAGGAAGAPLAVSPVVRPENRQNGGGRDSGTTRDGRFASLAGLPSPKGISFFLVVGDARETRAESRLSSVPGRPILVSLPTPGRAFAVFQEGTTATLVTACSVLAVVLCTACSRPGVVRSSASVEQLYCSLPGT